jgi:hypothetical protein
MRVLTVLLALAVGLSVTSADAKTRKKKRHHKPKSHSVQMDLQFEINGSLIATPHIAAELGKTATIIQQGHDQTHYAIDVTPTKPKAGQVMMAFEVSRIIDGRKEVIARPRMTMLSGEKARMEQKAPGEPTISIEATAKL